MSSAPGNGNTGMVSGKSVEDIITNDLARHHDQANINDDSLRRPFKTIGSLAS